MAFFRAMMLCTLGIAGCDQAETKPSPPAQPEAPPRPEFRFGPTLEAHKPADSAMELVAEVGDAATGTMTLVLAHHDGSALTLAAWRFSSTGEDDTLEPAGPPAPLLAVLPGQSTDADALDALLRTRAAAHTVKHRPQGVEAADAARALRTISDDARASLETDSSPAEQTKALARFTRGLDDGLLFSSSGVSRTLAVTRSTTPSSSTEESERRATFIKDEHQISMLKKGDGWVIDAVK